MANYLSRRGARYSYRRRCPKQVEKILGKTEYVKALGTSDRSEAIRLSHLASVEFDGECALVLERAAQNAPTKSSLAPIDYKTPQAIIGNPPILFEGGITN